MFNAHECIPSTSSSSANSGKLLIDNDRYCVRSAPCTMYKEHLYRTTTHPGGPEATAVYDVPKSSLPRTNPHCTGRSLGVSSAVAKPALVDVSNNGDDNQILMAVPVRSSHGVTTVDGGNEEVRECSTKWCYTEQRPSAGAKQWTRMDSRSLSQQEIIEQQKREIRRLMKENEELKRCVAAQKLAAHRQPASDTKNANSQPVADSGASDDSYDSFSSSNELQMSSTKAITHC
ncbi:unnamed protein product [Gongylonema pulchrum]|uniref:Coiled-coil domain-containing protein n=1 Tax=Gongylonema pulchrum TaxID=637853 RepID=A0A183D6C2_9BILA|nr:unnamed protein product [Gongylonema pulchrum]